MGRPTDYQPEFCERVIELGREGASKAQIAAALGVSRQTIDNWCEQHAEFFDAIAHARDFAMAWWEDQGRNGIWAGKAFNAQAWSRSMAARFPDDYRERQDVNLHADASIAEAIVAARQRSGA